MEISNNTTTKSFEFGYVKGFSYAALVKKYTKATLDNTNLTIEQRDFILGVIPKKLNTTSIPLEDIADIKIKNKFSVNDMIFILVATILSFVANPVAVIFLILFILTVSYKVIIISNNKGLEIKIFTGSKKTAVDFVEELLNGEVINPNVKIVGGIQLNQAKQKKMVEQKWYVWLVVVVILIISLLIFNSKGDPTSSTSTTTEKTTTKTENVQKPATVTPTAPNDVALYSQIIKQYTDSKLEIQPATSALLKDNTALFPAKSQADKDKLMKMVDGTIEYKHIEKNAEKYTDKIMTFSGTVVSAEESKMSDGTSITLIHILTNSRDSLQAIYKGTADDIFKDDKATVVGVPVGIYSFPNVSGGTTNCVMTIAGIIKKEVEN